MRSRPRELLRGIFLLFLGLWLTGCGPASYIFPPTVPPVSTREAEENLFQQAQESYRRQDYRQARLQYGAYINRYPQGRHNLLARLREADLVGLQGDWHDALRRYQALLARGPQPDIALPARYGVGRAYFKLGQYQQASQVLENLIAVELPPGLRFSTQALLTEISLKQGKVPQAFARLRLAAQDLPSGDKEWFDDLKTRLVEQATPQELENLEGLYRDSPLSAIFLLRLAKLAQKAGNSQEFQKWTSTLKERFPESPEAAGLERVLRGQTVLVGCLLPLTGDYSNFGRHVKQGMELAARGTPLELIVRDTPNNQEAGTRQVRDLTGDPRLVGILGPLGSAAALGAAQAAQEAQVPLIALSQKEGITRAGDFIFQAFLTARQQVRALLNRTAGQMGLKRYAVLYPDSAYGQAFMQQFLEEAAAQGVEVVLQVPYAPATHDFAPALTTLKAVFYEQQGSPGFQALFIPDDAATVAAAAGQLEGFGLKNLQLLGTNLLHVPDLPEAEARALEGAMFPGAFYAQDPSAAVQEFITAYRQQYNENPDYLAAQGYTVAKLFLKALAGDKDRQRAELPGKLAALKEFPDLPWFKGFNAEREAELSLYLFTIKNGAVQLVQ
ncbi:MAG: ABC transporter substrate-binding protein [Thermodesulfobacteriota bacterium]